MSNHTPLKKKKHIPHSAITLFFANLEGFYLAETVLLQLNEDRKDSQAAGGFDLQGFELF